MKVWLDDERPAPDKSWTLVKTVEAAIELLQTGNVTAISLDNDLGSGYREGYEVAAWIEEHAVAGTLPPIRPTFAHTQNTVAKFRMHAALRNAHAAWKARRPSE